ncbi:hypothetical protein QFX18_05235 [Saccharophagus degradans]|uniref:hypothetical protein n=1 Tax=Saccharophagus degradans TaxID=86304 RepID=UPI0024782CF6|nr:hypothetical protein [Saccharophagus degradans]WGO99464.1 hypothetical protein QFX18_05235 [Saccharophagus degradans]
MNRFQARLIVDIPSERFDIEGLDGREPKVGDIVDLDQGFTGEDGRQMILVYCHDATGKALYQAEVYDTEISS